MKNMLLDCEYIIEMKTLDAEADQDKSSKKYETPITSLYVYKLMAPQVCHITSSSSEWSGHWSYGKSRERTQHLFGNLAGSKVDFPIYNEQHS